MGTLEALVVDVTPQEQPGAACVPVEPVVVHGHQVSCPTCREWLVDQQEELARLQADNEVLRQQIQGHVERIAAQSELLSRRAEVPCGEDGTPLLTVAQYCEAFRTWVRAYREAADGEDATRQAQAFERALDTVFVDINKSCLLDRLLYGGEKLRTVKCPVHKGRWSGCVADPCPICSYGNNVTGWVRHDYQPMEK